MSKKGITIDELFAYADDLVKPPDTKPTKQYCLCVADDESTSYCVEPLDDELKVSLEHAVMRKDYPWRIIYIGNKMTCTQVMMVLRDPKLCKHLLKEICNV